MLLARAAARAWSGPEPWAAGRGAIIAPLDLVRSVGWRDRVRILRPAGRSLCFNSLHLLGLGAALASPDADTIRSMLAETGEGEEP
jgi:hypothetical protein